MFTKKLFVPFLVLLLFPVAVAAQGFPDDQTFTVIDASEPALIGTTGMLSIVVHPAVPPSNPGRVGYTFHLGFGECNAFYSGFLYVALSREGWESWGTSFDYSGDVDCPPPLQPPPVCFYASSYGGGPGTFTAVSGNSYVTGTF